MQGRMLKCLPGNGIPGTPPISDESKNLVFVIFVQSFQRSTVNETFKYEFVSNEWNYFNPR